MIGKWISGACAAAVAGTAVANSKYNFQDPNGVMASQINDLHIMVMWVCVVIFVGVFGVSLYSLIYHRKSVGHKAAHFHENTTVEIAWTVVPFFILIAMAVPATTAVIAQKDTSQPDLTVKVTGYQWKWGYEYLKGEGAFKDAADGVQIFSVLSTPREQIEGSATKGENYLLEVDRNFVVPVGAKVRLVITAADVLHAWWVPAVAAKQDAIPGFIRDTWFKADKEGIVRGQCAELCGKDHGFMPIVLEVVSKEKFVAWAAEQKKAQAKAAAADVPGKTWTMDELMAQGKKVYAQHCQACHQENGKGTPPTFPPLDGSALVAGPKGPHLDAVLNGVVKSGKPTMMTAFKQLSDVEIASVVTYERNSWGNKAGDMVAPAEVKAARK